MVEPGGHAQAEEVPAAENCTRREAEVLQRCRGELGHVGLEELIAVERTVAERVAIVFRLLQVLLVEAFTIDDQDPPRFEIAHVHFEGGGVHGDEDVQVVARREHLVRGEVQLEGADASQRAGWRADLGGEVGQGGEIVARQRRLGGELRARHLHAVARVAGEPDDHPVARLDALGIARCPVRHRPRPFPLSRAFYEEVRGVDLLGRCARCAVAAARGTRSGIPRPWRRCNLILRQRTRQSTRRSPSACGLPFFGLWPTMKLMRMPGAISAPLSSHWVMWKKMDCPLS